MEGGINLQVAPHLQGIITETRPQAEALTIIPV